MKPRRQRFLLGKRVARMDFDMYLVAANARDCGLVQGDDDRAAQSLRGRSGPLWSVLRSFYIPIQEASFRTLKKPIQDSKKSPSAVGRTPLVRGGPPGPTAQVP